MAAHFQQPRVALPRDLPDLPDFDQIAQHHRSLATEMAKCSNIPALDGGARILDAIRVLSTEMTTQIREMRGEIRELRGEIREVKMGLRASDINNIARLLNSALPTPDNELHPLHNTLTGEPMPNFPGTPAEIASMDSAAVNEALRALGADTTGRLEARRTRLRRCVGLRPVPV